MEEYICNLHIHSKYSDGSGNYQQIANAAINRHVDIIIVTDHNILVQGLEGYRFRDGRQCLVLSGEEVHDQDRMPQKNHTLVVGSEKECAQFAADPQNLMTRVMEAGGLSFLAHPYESALPLFHETDISWDSWEVQDFTGIELWNSFSEFKTVVQTMPQALYYAFQPDLIQHGPLSQTLAKWDELLSKGNHVVAVGGSDAHAQSYRSGPIKKIIFPYEFHFSAINNHLLLDKPLNGDLEHDKRLVYHALQKGTLFIGNDLISPSQGFRFSAENDDSSITMGEELFINRGATIRINLPQPASIRFLHNGQVIQSAENSAQLVQTITEPGAYRLEAYLRYRGKSRGWIFSNPIYISKLQKAASHDQQ